MRDSAKGFHGTCTDVLWGVALFSSERLFDQDSKVYLRPFAIRPGVGVGLIVSPSPSLTRNLLIQKNANVQGMLELSVGDG